MLSNGRPTKQMNIIVSSAGRRLELINCVREGLSLAGIEGSVYAADCSPSAPALHWTKKAWLVPRCNDAQFVPEMCRVCDEGTISLILPTIDPELPVFARHQDRFSQCGISVSVSDELTLDISSDKVLTHEWLEANRFPTVRQARPDEVLESPDKWKFPLIVKPRFGSASVGVRRIRSAAELRAASELETDLIVQEIAPGEEYTVNVFVDKRGRCLCAVPHLRLEVRGGEVSKAVTVKNPRLMYLARSIAESLPGAYGLLNIQAFVSRDSEIRVIEINPRVGGGYPLSHRAGGHFTRWLIEEAAGITPVASFDGWLNDLAMLRYDQTMFRCGSSIRTATNQHEAVSSAGS